MDNKTKRVFIERNKLFKNIPMILCNNISAVDTSFVEDNFELFMYDCAECKGTGKIGDTETACEECMGEGQHESEPYQEFIVDVNERDIERLKSYGVNVGYSNALELYILPIYDFGTSWSAFSYSKEVDNDYELSFDETLTRSTVY